MLAYQIVFWVWAAVAAGIFVVLFFVRAPYGRHRRSGWGPAIPRRLGWIVMELPAALVPAAYFVVSGRRDAVSWAFIGLWSLHYLNRALIFPLRLRGRGRVMPLVVVGSGVAFNLVNGYLIGRYLFGLGPELDLSWFRDPRFAMGLSLFLVGWLTNVWADAVLRDLRQPGTSTYRIPEGGLYRLISCPNYFGEILEWLGFAMLTWSAPGLLFTFWTAANLVPRAHAHRKWYRRQFEDYPRARKRLLPFVW